MRRYIWRERERPVEETEYFLGGWIKAVVIRNTTGLQEMWLPRFSNYCVVIECIRWMGAV